MSKTNSTILFGFFVAVIAALCGASLLKGGFYLGKHEGDTFHLLQIVFRMADGQIPHLDFMTPIGVMAFAPIVLFVKLGYGIGHSIILAQALVSVVFLPAIWWVARTRMHGILAYTFGLIVLVLIAALVHGEAQRSVSISMHYNRWAWAAAFVAIAAAVLPSQRPGSGRIDGLIIGLAMAFLLLTKVTYFAAFSVPIVVALLARGSAVTLIYAVATGLVAAALVTGFAGIEFWQAYLADLITVARSEIRPSPGEPLGAVVGAPAYLGASLTLMAGVVFLRQSRETVGGLVLLLLVPGFFYVTFQNFANDPQWLLLLGVLLLAMLPTHEICNGLGWDMRNALKLTAAVAFALAAPSFFNMAYSPFRHLAMNVDNYSALLPRSERHGDIYAVNVRKARTNVKIPIQIEGTGLEAYDELAEFAEPAVFKGETFPRCEILIGLPAWFDVITADLEQAGFAGGTRVFAADLFSSHWLFGDFKPLEGGAPWYYGGLPGIQSADYLLVPICPVLPDLRKRILDAIKDAELKFTEVRRTPLYVL